VGGKLLDGDNEAKMKEGEVGWNKQDKADQEKHYVGEGREKLIKGVRIAWGRTG